MMDERIADLDDSMANCSWICGTSIKYNHSLEEANRLKALLYLPVTSFVTLVLAAGTFGNASVLFIYKRRFKKRAAYYFIMSMAVFDLIGCLLAMPLEIYDLLNPYTFYSSIGCKFFRFVESATTLSSVIILVEIGYDRYMKICKPTKIFRITTIKRMCFMAAILGIVLAGPTFALFGITRDEIKGTVIRGYDCSIEDEFKKGLFPKIHYGIISLLFAVALVLLLVFYTRVWQVIRKRKDVLIRDRRRRLSGGRENSCSEYTNSRMRIVPQRSISDDENMNGHMSGTESLKRRTLNLIAEYPARMKASKTTVILFTVTVAFILSFLPGIIVMVCRSTIKSLEENQSDVQDLLMKFSSKLYLINCAINPIIYSFMNETFRAQCAGALRLNCCLPKNDFQVKFRRSQSSECSNNSRASH